MAYPATQAAPAAARTPAAPAGGTDWAALAKALSAAPNTAGIAAQASAQARSDVAAQLAAIHAQQQTELAQASQRAQQINAAALASSGYLDHLGFGERLRAAFQQAGQDQAATAQGFSGDLRQIAGGEADRVNANLAALGAPGQAPSAEGAANVVYGLGAIPANVLTASAPLALARTQALPAQLLGAGQAEAVGALGAGQAAAARYNPQLTAAIGGLPKLERGYLTQLQTSAAKARQDAIGNLFKAVSAQQAGDRITAQAAYHDAQLAAATYRDQTAAYYKGVSAAQAGQRLDLTASRDATLAAQGAARLKETSAHNTELEKTAGIRAQVAVDKARGYSVGADGKKTVLPGFKFNSAGSVVKTATKVSKPGGLSQKDWDTAYAKINGHMDDWYHGVPELKDARGQVTQPRQDALTYQQAFRQIKALYPTIPTKKALQLLNLYYKPGEGGRPLPYGEAGSPYLGPPTPVNLTG